MSTYYVQLNKDNILKKTTQEAIMEKYLGLPVDLDKSYINPLRNDHEPGCKYWYSKTGKLYFHDFSRGFMWDCFAVVQHKYDLSFYAALSRINKDMALNLNKIANNERSIHIPEKIPKYKKRKSIQSIPTA